MQILQTHGISLLLARFVIRFVELGVERELSSWTNRMDGILVMNIEKT